MMLFGVVRACRDERCRRPLTGEQTKWCSKKCAQRVWLEGFRARTEKKVGQKCPICADTFYKRETNHKKVYCSKECSTDAFVLKRKKREQKKLRANMASVSCVLCGKRGCFGSRTRKYCSDKCMIEVQWRKVSEKRRASGYYKRRRQQRRIQQLEQRLRGGVSDPKPGGCGRQAGHAGESPTA